MKELPLLTISRMIVSSAATMGIRVVDDNSAPVTLVANSAVSKEAKPKAADAKVKAVPASKEGATGKDKPAATESATTDKKAKDKK